MQVKVVLALTAAVGLSFVAPAPEALAEDFYAGKRVRLIVGSAPGGGTDAYSRIIARHIGKHIPGNPAIVVANMPGAGGLITANFIYNRAKPDGLTVGFLISAPVRLQVLGHEAAAFDVRKFGWIGSPTNQNYACAVMGFTGLRTFDDVMKSPKKIIKGATAVGGGTYATPALLIALVNAPFEIISGYPGTSPIRIAMKRREADGICAPWLPMRALAREMLDAEGDEKLIPYLIDGHFDHPEVSGLPQFTEVLKGELNLAVWRLAFDEFNYHHPLALPPNTPGKRLEILRAAFKRMFEDPAFKAEVRKAGLDAVYTSGDQIEKSIQRTLAAASPEAVQKLKAALELR